MRVLAFTSTIEYLSRLHFLAFRPPFTVHCTHPTVPVPILRLRWSYAPPKQPRLLTRALSLAYPLLLTSLPSSVSHVLRLELQQPSSLCGWMPWHW